MPRRRTGTGPPPDPCRIRRTRGGTGQPSPRTARRSRSRRSGRRQSCPGDRWGRGTDPGHHQGEEHSGERITTPYTVKSKTSINRRATTAKVVHPTKLRHAPRWLPVGQHLGASTHQRRFEHLGAHVGHLLERSAPSGRGIQLEPIGCPMWRREPSVPVCGGPTAGPLGPRPRCLTLWPGRRGLPVPQWSSVSTGS